MNRPRAFYWKWYAERWRGHLAFGLFLVLLTVVATAVSVVFPIFFKYLIDALASAAGSDSPDAMRSLRARFLALLFAIGLFRFLASLYPYFRAKMNLVLEIAARREFFDRILEKGPRFFLRFRTGDLVTRLTDDLSNYPKVAWFGCSGLFRAFNSASIVIFCAAAMAWLHPRLTLIALLPLPLAFLLYHALSRKLRDAYDDCQRAISTTNNHLEACFSGVRILKAAVAESREADRFDGVLAARRELDLRAVRLSGLLHLFFEFVGHASQATVVIFGGRMVLSGELSIGDYYAFFTFLSMIVYPMLDLPNLLVTSSQAFVCIDRLEALRESPDPAARCGAAPLPGGRFESLDLEGVSFAYGDPDGPAAGSAAAGAVGAAGDPFRLDEVSLTIRRGETVALVGPIGAGKTTLLHLAAGILSPDAGTVRVNGADRATLDPADLLPRLGFVGQEPLVFSETVGGNIDFFRGLPRERLERAARLARFDAECAAFPGGYDQPVGQRGVTLSGGQKQRLTIARALAGTPELLLMDDMTASLDAENEERFWRNLADGVGDAAVMVATHRLATARRADRIVVLHDGRVESVGTFAELARTSPVFQSLLAG